MRNPKHRYPTVLAVLLFTALIALTVSAQELGVSPLAVQSLDEFQIVELTAQDYHVIDHDGATGDDRGGIATSGSRVLVTGDNSTASYRLSDLGGGFALGEIYDVLVSDLKTGQIYLLGHGGNPIPVQAGDQNVSQLLLVDGETGALTGEAIPLAPPFVLNTTYQTGGMFAGYGRVVVYDGTTSALWSIETPSGAVSSLASLVLPTYYGCETWAIWGIAEYWGGESYLVYRGENEEIWRTRVSDGDTTVLATFSNLSDLCSLTASVGHNRWYFHYESSGQFGGNNETLGYARAVLDFPGGHLAGHVHDALTGAPLQGAVVSAGFFQARTDAAGYYAIKLPAGSYTVSAEDPLHIAGSVAAVQITLEGLVTQNFSLMPKVTITPSSVHATLAWQTTGTAGFTVRNYMAEPYEFTFGESAGGFVPRAPAAQGSAVALVSDDGELGTIIGILDDMNLAYDRWDDEDTDLHLADPAFLAGYRVIVWYTHDRQITQGEHDALEAWLQAGGRLLVTGYDSLGSPDDPLLADLVRSSQYGDYTDGVAYQILLDHPVTNGRYGVYPPGTQLSVDETDHDDAVADTARNAEAVATVVGYPIDKIIATELGSGAVVYWNGNYNCHDWAPSKNPLAIGSADSFDGQNLFKNTLEWLLSGSDVPWLGQQPLSGSVPAGGTLDVTLLFTATYHAGINQPGDYDATLRTIGEPRLNVPVKLTVLPPADLGRVGGVVLDRCSGEGAMAEIAIAGGVPISATTSDPETGRYAAWLAPGTYELEFSAGGYLTYGSTVNVSTATPTTLDVDLVPDRPCLAVEPDRFEVWLQHGTEVYTHPAGLRITNPGGQPLEFAIYERGGEAGKNRTGAGITDPFGYTLIDSHEPLGPIYDWIEIAPLAGGDGTAIAFNDLDDSHFWPLNLPRPFTFYGVDYTQMAVATNGTLYFENAYNGATNDCLPGTGYGVANYIAHLWDDLFISPGAVYYKDLGNKFVIEFYRVSGYDELSDPGTWQIVLYDNGSILFQYQDVDFGGTSYDNGIGATVGIQALTADPPSYLQYSCNQPALEPELAVCFAYPGSDGCDFPADVPWIWQEPMTGTVPSGVRSDVQVMFTALYPDHTLMPMGTYRAELLVVGNVPGAPVEKVPVTMHIARVAYLPIIVRNQ
jgi:hypothetical protein